MGVTLTKNGKKKFFMTVRHAGKRESHCLGLIDKRTAMVRVRAVRKELALGTYRWKKGDEVQRSGVIWFGDFAKDFIQTHHPKYMKLKYSTWNGYKNNIRAHLIPAWGKKTLTGITKADVKKLLQARQQKGKRIGNLKITISAIFEWAVNTSVLKENPAHRLGKGFKDKKKDAKEEMQVLSSEQVKKLLERVKKDAPEWHDFLLFLCKTGMRIGEVRATAFEDLDFGIGKIKCCRNYTHNRWETPKTGQVRFVTMSKALVAMLKERTPGEQPIVVEGKKIHLVFANKNGMPINDRYFRERVFRPALEKLGLPKLRCHDLRHTYASILLMHHAPTKFVADQLGHSSTAVTLKVYEHYIESENNFSVDVLDD